MKKGLVFLLALFTCFMVAGCGNDKKDPIDVNNGNGGNVDNGNGNSGNTGVTDPNGNEEKISSFTLKNDVKQINLSKEEEAVKINDLTLKFYGEDASSTTEVNNSFKYVLKLDLNGIEISSNIFSNPMLRTINSDNLSSTFNVYSIDDLYILKSSTGAQKEGDYVLVIDNEGNFIRSMEDADVKIDAKAKTLNLVNCLTLKEDEDCFKANYKISGKELKLES